MGKASDKATKIQIKNNFQVITVGEDLIPLCEKVLKDPSHDQKYGRRMVKAIRSGNLPADLAALEIGPVNHSRWLTTANRFLRMYCSKNGFSGKDERNLNLIVEVYFPMWFNIKVHHSWLEGPRHALHQVKLVNLQQKEVQDIVTQ